MKQILVVEKYLGFNMDSPKERRRFLAEMSGIPYTSVIGDDDRLFEHLKTWIND